MSPVLIMLQAMQVCAAVTLLIIAVSIRREMQKIEEDNSEEIIKQEPPNVYFASVSDILNAIQKKRNQGLLQTYDCIVYDDGGNRACKRTGITNNDLSLIYVEDKEHHIEFLEIDGQNCTPRLQNAGVNISKMVNYGILSFENGTLEIQL